MKRKWISVVCVGCIITSCSMIHRLERERTTVNVALPKRTEPQQKPGSLMPNVIEYRDKDGGNRKFIMESEKDSTGEQQLIMILGEVVVIAKTRSVPERFGKVDINFVVSVPDKLVRKHGQLTLTPNLLKKGTGIAFNDIVISGGGFHRKQVRGYQKYANYLNKQIRKDSLAWEGFSSYSSDMQGRYEVFNKKMHRSRAWLRNVLGFAGIKERYKLFGQDTTHVSKFYDRCFEEWAGLLPQFHLLRQPEDRMTPARYRKERFKSPFTREVPEAVREAAFARFVTFPKNPDSRLDTVLYRKGGLEYHYHQELTTDEDSKRMELYLSGEVLSKKGESYVLPSSDTLAYVVSSMIQFANLTPRFQRRIVERKATSSLKAYITFPSGKSVLDESLADNANELKKVQEMVTSLTETGEFVMDSITLVAKSSPEGSALSNRQLSNLRGQSIKKYLHTQLEAVEGIDTMLLVHAKGEDWEGLVRWVQEHPQIPHAAEIIDIATKNSHPDRKEAEIRKRYPADYGKMRKDIYPFLRAVDFTFYIHRAGMVKDTIHTTEPDTLYASAIQWMQERKYSSALNILADYNDRNTAICLMSLGYDESAYQILLKESEDGDSEYLLAILSARLGREDEAVKRYLHACELDDSKHWRGVLDPEINRLIKAYGLDKDEN